METNPVTLGSGRNIGGIPDPEDYDTVTLGSGRDAIYRTSSDPLPVGGDSSDYSMEPVPVGVAPTPAIEEPVPASEDDEAAPAFTMAKQPDSPLSDAEHEKDVGWWQNAGRGFLNRLGDDLLTNLGQFGNKVVDKVTEEGGDYMLPVLGARAAAGYLEEAGAAIGGRDYRVRGDWETVENSWAKVSDSEEVALEDIANASLQTGEFMLETGVVSTPDMFAMVAAMPAYLASRVEELATDRAKADGRELPTAEDYVVGGLTATIVTAIDKMSFGFATKPVKKLLEKGIAPALKRIGTATAVETGQEAVQETLEYLGTGVGTKQGVTAEEAKRRALAGGVGGAGFGAGVSTVSNVVGAFKAPPPEESTTGQVEVGTEGDDDYLPTAEEEGVLDEDIITPPPPEGDEVVEESPTSTGEAKTTDNKASEPVPTIEENLRKAWKDAPQKVPKAAVEKAVAVGVHPKDVPFTGKDGAYKAGDIDVALNINKVGDTDETIAAALKAAGQEEAGETGTTKTEVRAEDTAPGSGGSDRSVAGETGSGTDTPAVGSEGTDAEAEASIDEKPPALTKKFSRTPYATEAAELGLIDADFEGVSPNKQGVHTKADLKTATANKAKRDRGPLRSETEEVLAFIEDNLPKSDQYKSEQTGRTRSGGLDTKASAVGSLVTLVDRLHKKSSAPAEVIERAVELAGEFRRLSSLNEDQMAGKGFTNVINAATLDPAIDELSELVQALDQNRQATEGTINKVDATLVEKAEAAQAEVEAEAAPLTPQQLAEKKSDLAKKRKKVKEVEQGIRRSKGGKAELLAETQKKLKEIAAAESLLDEKANVVIKSKPKAKKRAAQKKGKPAPVVGKEGQRPVKAESIKGVKEAKQVFSLLGIPEQVTTAAKHVGDIPINMNHYSLLVGLYRGLKRTETAAVKSKDAATEQQAKQELRALAQVTKDIISSPDETRDLAHERAAGELAKFNVHEDVINDVIDFAEASRTVVQREVARAEETTETVREITVEEHMAEQAADAEQQGSLQEQIETAMEAGNWDRVAELQAQEAVSTDTSDADQVLTDLESDTIPLSDEFDANDASNSSFDSYSDSQRDSAPRLKRILAHLKIKGTPALRKLFRQQQAQANAASRQMFGEESNNPQHTARSASDYLDRIIGAFPPSHPYSQLAGLLKSYGNSETIVEWVDTLPPGVEGRHSVVYFGTQERAGVTHWQIQLSNNMKPEHAIRVLLHELIHNHTATALHTDNEVAVSLDNLRKDILTALDEVGDALTNTIQLQGGNLYGLTNVDEFLAEAFTNPDFQLMLMSLQVSPDTTVKAPTKRVWAWEKFVRIVRNVFGAKKFSAFDEVMRLAPSVFHGETAYDEVHAPGKMLKMRSSTAGEVDRDSGDVKRVVNNDVVRNWTIQRDRIVHNAGKELGQRGEEIAQSSYSMMQGNDPQTLGDLKDGSDKAIDNVVRRMAGGTLEQGLDAASNLRTIMGSVSLAVQTFDQIVRNHADKFKTATGNALTEYEAVMRNKNRIAARWQNRGAAIDEQWAGVEKAGNGTRFAQFVQDVTLAEVHPDYSWDAQKHLFSKQEQPIAEAQHAAIQKQWRKLSKQERATFIAKRKYFIAQRKQLATNALQHLTRTFIKDPEAAGIAFRAVKKHKTVAAARASSVEVDAIFDAASDNLVDSMERVLGASKQRGAYFPLRRFGDIVVDYSKTRNLGKYKSKKVAKAHIQEWRKEHPSNKKATLTQNDNGEWEAVAVEESVEFFESRRKAKNAIKQLRKDGFTTKDEPTLKEDWGHRFDVGSVQVLHQAGKKFKTDPALTKAVNERNASITAALQAAFIELLAENSIRKSSLQRKGVRGASLDGRRVFAERVFGGSYALADSETMFDQIDGLAGLWSVARQGGENAFKAGQVAREMTLRERHNVNDRRSNRFNDWVGSLGFLGFLAGPSYPIINASQPYMVGLPWLGARYGLKATGAMISNASKFGPAVMKELIDSGMGVKRDPHQAIQNAIDVMSKSGVAGGVEMLNAMRDAGIMDSTFIDAVSEAAKGAGGNISKSGLFKFAASAPKVVEVLNRTVMATTAYQLEMQKSGNKEKAIGVAKEAILQTQFDYSDFNKPRAFKNTVARPFLLFKMYPQGIYGLMFAAVKQATNGSAEEKRIGRNTLLGITASHTIMGGALGGIFMEPVRMLLSAIEMLYPIDDDDKENLPFLDKQQFDITMRQAAVDLLGDEYLAELAMRGIPRAFGGDLSSRLGLHNLMLMGMSGSTEDNVLQKIIEQVGGAPLSVVGAWIKAWKYMAHGDYQRGMETAAPKALRDVMNSARAGTRGLETFNGATYMQPEEFSGFDHFVKMMGFSPAKTAELMEERWAQMSYSMRMTARKKQTLDRLMNGNLNMKELNRWNVKHPDYRIGPGEIIRRRAGNMKAEIMDYKGYPVEFGKPSISKQARF